MTTITEPAERAEPAEPTGAPVAPITITLAWIEAGRAVCRETSLPGLPAAPTFGDLLTSTFLRDVLPAGALDGRYGWSVFGLRRRPDETIRPGDRVEILPALQVDPKTARRLRVDERRQQSRRDRWHTPRQPA